MISISSEAWSVHAQQDSPAGVLCIFCVAKIAMTTGLRDAVSCDEQARARYETFSESFLEDCARSTAVANLFAISQG
jgi:hypothetical protein